MKVGDIVKVDYVSREGNRWDWSGLLVWTCGYKFEFLIDGDFETWTSHDLNRVGAEVISASR